MTVLNDDRHHHSRRILGFVPHCSLGHAHSIDMNFLHGRSHARSDTSLVRHHDMSFSHRHGKNLGLRHSRLVAGCSSRSLEVVDHDSPSLDFLYYSLRLSSMCHSPASTAEEVVLCHLSSNVRWRWRAVHVARIEVGIEMRCEWIAIVNSISSAMVSILVVAQRYTTE